MESNTTNFVIVGAIIAAIGLIFGVGKWVGSVNTDRRTFSSFMDEIRSDIKEILSRLPSKPVEQVQSPISLTDYGKEISDSVNAVDIAGKYVDKLCGEVKDLNAYETQEHYNSYISRR